jgi:hypothetical protein
MTPEHQDETLKSRPVKIIFGNDNYTLIDYNNFGKVVHIGSRLRIKMKQDYSYYIEYKDDFLCMPLHKYIVDHIPYGQTVIHVDGNKFNNTRSNLELISKKEVSLMTSSTNHLGKGIDIVQYGNGAYYRCRIRFDGKVYSKLFKIEEPSEDILYLTEAREWIRDKRQQLIQEVRGMM